MERALKILKSDERRCATCAYWQQGHENNHGECRNKPPTPASFHGIWPLTGANDWCGQHYPHREFESDSNGKSLVVFLSEKHYDPVSTMARKDTVSLDLAVERLIDIALEVGAG